MSDHAPILTETIGSRPPEQPADSLTETARGGREGSRLPPTVRVVVAASALAVLCVALFAAQQPHPWTTLATALALSAASAVSGLLLGFVFGVPRVLAADRPRSTGTGGGIAANTS
jgi:hypothetical protein